MKQVKRRLKGFPYQLTEWQKDLSSLNSAIEPFRKYSEEKYAVIVNSKEGFAIFSTGKNILNYGNEKSTRVRAYQREYMRRRRADAKECDR